MKKYILSALVICCLFLTGCLETTEEITLNENGSGTISTTSDASAMFALIKTMGGGADMEKVPGTDTTYSLKDKADNIPGLSADEKKILGNGTMKEKVSAKDEKAYSNVSFSFSSPSEIQVINKITSKVLAQPTAMAALMKDAPPGTADQMPPVSSLDDYYDLEFSNGELTRKVNKTKYAGAESDEFLKAMKQLAQAGLSMKVSYTINLPRPATKAEGKNVKLSDDKKQVKISADLDDFFADASALEFKIKY